MEMRQLKYFLSVIEHGGFNRAADAVNVTQPALSKSMKALEDELGVQLLDRSGSQVVPTAYGKILARGARLAEGELQRSIKQINVLVERGGGRLIVGGGGALRYFLPPTLDLLKQRESSIEIVVVEALAVPVLSLLARGEVDVAICPPAVEELPSGLRHEHLLTDDMTVVAHASHSILAQRNLNLADLQRYGWVMPGRQEKERQVLEHAFLTAGLPPPSIVVETSSSALMLHLLEQQQLLSCLSSLALRNDRASENLRAVEVEVPWKPRALHVFWRDASTALPLMEAFLSCITQAAQGMRSTLSRSGERT